MPNRVNTTARNASGTFSPESDPAGSAAEGFFQDRKRLRQRAGSQEHAPSLSVPAISHASNAPRDITYPSLSFGGRQSPHLSMGISSQFPLASGCLLTGPCLLPRENRWDSLLVLPFLFDLAPKALFCLTSSDFPSAVPKQSGHPLCTPRPCLASWPRDTGCHTVLVVVCCPQMHIPFPWSNAQSLEGWGCL